MPETSPSETGLGRFRRPARAIVSLSWVPLVASALAVVLSLASIYVSTREPEVVAILPDVVRLVGGRQSGSSYVYLQPAFVSTGVNDRVEVIADMVLLVERADGSESATMSWQEQASLVTDAEGALSYRYAADAVPLLVGPRSAATPLALFQAPAGWFFGRAGTASPSRRTGSWRGRHCAPPSRSASIPRTWRSSTPRGRSASWPSPSTETRP